MVSKWQIGIMEQLRNTWIIPAIGAFLFTMFSAPVQAQHVKTFDLSGVAYTTFVIFQEDFEGDFHETADSTWDGSAEGQVTGNAGEVISGEYSYKLRGGKIGTTDPNLHTTPGIRLRIAFSYKVVDPNEAGDFPHTEVRLVGKNQIVPYLKANITRQNKKEGYDDPEGRYTTDAFVFPFEDDLRLIFRCIGPAAVVVDDIEVQRVDIMEAPTGHPHLTSPDDGAELQNGSLRFSWTTESQVTITYFDIQVDETNQFNNPVTASASIGGNWEEQNELFNYYPEHHYQPGTYYWRMRARNEAGNTRWSDARSFSIRETGPMQPPPFTPTPGNPLFQLEGGEDTWDDDIPDDLKDHVVLRVRDLNPENYGEEEDFWDKLETFEEREIPVLLFQYRPGPELEELFRNYESVKGVVYNETGAHGGTLQEMRNEIIRSLELAAEYGKMVFWQDGSWRQLTWVRVATDPALFQAMKKYRDYFVPQNKLNFPFNPMLSRNTLIGLWISDHIRYWGSQPEGWYYHPWRDRDTFPPAFYGQMVLSAAAGGASVYSPNIHRGTQGRDGFSRSWTHFIVPLFRMMVSDSLIASKQDVREKITKSGIGFLSDQEHSKNVGGQAVVGGGIEWGSGDFFTLYDGTYGMRHQAEVIPNTSRYYYIPLFSSLLPDEFLMSYQTVGPKRFDSKETVQSYLPDYFPEPDNLQGSAFMAEVDQRCYIMHNQEFSNQDIDINAPVNIEEQDFRVTLDHPTVSAMAGTLDMHQYAVVLNKRVPLKIHLGNGWGKRSRIYLNAGENPVITMDKPEYLLEQEWSPEEERLAVTVDHADGPVTLILEEASGLRTIGGLQFALKQNYPNPFNSATTIRFSLPREQRIHLAVYDVLGSKVATLLDREMASGQHSVRWTATSPDGKPVSSGVYFLKLTGGESGKREIRKITLLR